MDPTDHTPAQPIVEAPPALVLRIGEARMPLVENRTYSIGSEAGNDIRFVHSSIAPHHAKLTVSNQQIFIEDLGSRSGVWIGAHRLEAGQVLLPGMSVRVGEIPMEIVDPEAAETLVIPTVVAHHLSERFATPSFSEIMADQLRQAPWFAMSVLFHILLFWLLYLLVPDRESDSGTRLTVVMSSDDAVELLEVEETEEEVQVEEIQPEAVIQDVEVEQTTMGEEVPDQPFDEITDVDASLFGPKGNLFQQLSGKRGNDVLELGGSAISKGFKRTVGKLRRSGLDIVFVFDSTGSMGPILAETKQTISRMVDVLHELVEDSRIGIITYRDNDQDEEYLTRAVPLGSDYYRSINFMHTVRANGGGDTPEAVLEGLQTAFGQSWGKGARRVVILVGDAPAHRETMRRLRRMTANFTRDKRSFVHTIITPRDAFGDISGEARECFERIAESGKGACVPFEREDSLLREVLSLAIGREFRRNIDEVYRIVDERGDKISTRMRDLVRRGDVESIKNQLRRRRIDDDLVRALVKTEDPRVAAALVEVLTQPKFSTAGRHAASFALMRLLDLERPPLDPDSGKTITRRQRRLLETRIRQRLGEPTK